MTYESKRKSVFENDVLKYKVEIVLKYKFKSAAKNKTMTKVIIWLQITRWFYCMDIEYVASYEYQTLKQTQVIRLVSSKSFLKLKRKKKNNVHQLFQMSPIIFQDIKKPAMYFWTEQFIKILYIFFFWRAI